MNASRASGHRLSLACLRVHVTWKEFTELASLLDPDPRQSSRVSWDKHPLVVDRLLGRDATMAVYTFIDEVGELPELVPHQDLDMPRERIRAMSLGPPIPRQGPWMRLISGRKFYPEDPRPEDFGIEDIAHALSMICRFGGHTPVFYSVAEHSVRVADALWDFGVEEGLVPRTDRIAMMLEGLLHDGAEALIGDMVWPVKHSRTMHGYRALEKDIEKPMRQAFGLLPHQPSAVKHYDLVLLATEKRDLLGRSSDASLEAAKAREDGSLSDWHSDGVKPLQGRIEPWSQAEAKRIFITRYQLAVGLRRPG